MALQLATRKKVKLRMSIASPTGFGKTVSALILAHGITNDWKKIAIIDTENESASLYSDHKLPNGYIIGEYFTDIIEPPFTPEKYIEAIRSAEAAGMEVIIIDSVTHVWSGQGGLLEYNDSLGGNKFQNWAKTTPRYQAWLNAILHSKCHVITTNRKKQAYALINEGGKSKVEKQGMEDQIRDGYDYEMTIAFELINDKNMCRAAKDRTSLFVNKPEFVITEETGRMIKAWCESGVDAKPEEKKLPDLTPALLNKVLDKAGSGEQVLDKTKAAFTLTEQQVYDIQRIENWYKEINAQANGELERLAAAHANEMVDVRIKSMFEKRAKEIGQTV